MARILVSRLVNRPVEVVWSGLADLPSHVNWMEDAVAIEFGSEQRTGVGTSMRVETRVGPLRTLDRMDVVGWDEGHSIEVVHTGLVTGRGTLGVAAENGASRVTWDEELRFPWWLGGPITAWLARPVLGRIWSKNLANFEETLNSP